MGAVTRDQSGDLRRNPPSLYTILRGLCTQPPPVLSSAPHWSLAVLHRPMSVSSCACIGIRQVRIAIKRCCIALGYVRLCHCLMAHCSCLEAMSFYCAPGNIL